MAVDIGLPAKRSARLALTWLFLGTFVVGSAELLVAGLLNLISEDLRVSVSAAGLLVTANAVGLAVGGPILTLITLGINKRPLLLATLGAHLVFNLVPVLVPEYPLFVAARIAGGAAQGLFVAAAFSAAGAQTSPERRGRAIAVILTGFTVAATVGVPAGTLAGRVVGWRGAFAIVVALATLALLASPAMLPKLPKAPQSAYQIKGAFGPRVGAILLLIFLVFSAVGAVLTYLVPLLRYVTHIPAEAVSGFLLAYGIASAVGSIGGGRLADKNSPRMCVIGTVGLCGSLLALYLARSIPVLVLLAMLAWGLCAFGMGPALQHRVVSLAGDGSDLAASLPASAANLGIACGSAVGGAAIAAFSVNLAPLAGTGFAALSASLAWLTIRLR